MTPEETMIEDMVTVLNALKDVMPEESLASFERAIATAKTFGIPPASTYSLTHIDADDLDDLNLKAHLAITPIYIEYINGGITMSELLNLVSPITLAVTNFILNNGFNERYFPASIKVNNEYA